MFETNVKFIIEIGLVIFSVLDNICMLFGFYNDYKTDNEFEYIFKLYDF